MSEQQPIIGIFLISTNNYWIYIQQLVDSINKYFLTDNKIIIHLFTDVRRFVLTTDRVKIKQYAIEPYKFPYATLLRYKIFTENADLTDEDYLAYLDIDMKIIAPIGTEFLNEITVVRHPGFYANNGWGSPNVVANSTAYLEPERRKEYVCGGVNSGSRKEFMKICHILAHHISIDEENGVMAEWHDESHLNYLISTMEDRDKLKILSPSYCMPEQKHLRLAWHLENLEPKIIALEKVHSEIRN